MRARLTRERDEARARVAELEAAARRSYGCAAQARPSAIGPAGMSRSTFHSARSISATWPLGVAGHVGHAAVRAHQDLLRRLRHVEGPHHLHRLQVEDAHLVEAGERHDQEAAVRGGRRAVGDAGQGHAGGELVRLRVDHRQARARPGRR